MKWLDLYNIAVNCINILQIVFINAQAVLPVKTVSNLDVHLTCLRYIMMWINDINNRICITILWCCEHNNFIERRDLLQKLLEKRPKQSIHGNFIRTIGDLRCMKRKRITLKTLSYTSMGSITQWTRVSSKSRTSVYAGESAALGGRRLDCFREGSIDS